MRLLLVTIFFITFNSAWASINPKTTIGDEYPSYARFYNNEQHSRIEAHCSEKRKTGKITCSFDQVIVNHVDTEQLKIAIFEAKKGNKDKEIQDEIKSSCKYLNNKEMNKKYSESNSYEFKKIILAIRELCTKPSKENYIAFLETQLQLREMTCGVFSKSYNTTFQYNSATKKWNYLEDPNASTLFNDCGFINFSSIEKDQNKGDLSWYYTSRDIMTNKTGKIGTSKCSELAKGKNSLEKEITYSTEYSNHADPYQLLNCKYIDYSEL